MNKLMNGVLQDMSDIEKRFMGVIVRLYYKNKRIYLDDKIVIVKFTIDIQDFAKKCNYNLDVKTFDDLQESNFWKTLSNLRRKRVYLRSLQKNAIDDMQVFSCNLCGTSDGEDNLLECFLEFTYFNSRVFDGTKDYELISEEMHDAISESFWHHEENALH